MINLSKSSKDKGDDQELTDNKTDVKTKHIKNSPSKSDQKSPNKRKSNVKEDGEETEEEESHENDIKNVKKEGNECRVKEKKIIEKHDAKLLKHLFGHTIPDKIDDDEDTIDESDLPPKLFKQDLVKHSEVGLVYLKNRYHFM